MYSDRSYEHQDYPLEELVDRLGVQREMSRNPLFDTTFALQNMERQQLSMEGLELRQKDNICPPLSAMYSDRSNLEIGWLISFCRSSSPSIDNCCRSIFCSANAFALQNMERQQLSMEGLELRQKDISHPISKFDLSLYMAESGGQILSFCRSSSPSIDNCCRSIFCSANVVSKSGFRLISR